MFYLFRMLEDLKIDGSYWKKFEVQLWMYSEEQENSEQKKNKKKNKKYSWNIGTSCGQKGSKFFKTSKIATHWKKSSYEQGILFFFRQNFNSQILWTQRIQRMVKRNRSFLT